MAKVTKTMQQALSYKPHYAAWFEETQRLEWKKPLGFNRYGVSHKLAADRLGQ